jgi:hypothetical protein
MTKPSLYSPVGFDENQKFASVGGFNRKMLEVAEIKEAREDVDNLFCPFSTSDSKSDALEPDSKVKIEFHTQDVPIEPGSKVDIGFRTQVGGHLIYLVTSLDSKIYSFKIEATIFDVDSNGDQIASTKRMAPLQSREEAPSVCFFRERNKMWISEKLVLTVENSGSKSFFPSDFVAIMEVDTTLNKLEATRYDGSTGFIRDVGGKIRRLADGEGGSHGSRSP